MLVIEQLMPVIGSQSDPRATVAFASTLLRDECRNHAHHVHVATCVVGSWKLNEFSSRSEERRWAK